MAALLALAGIVGGSLTSLMAFPVLGPWALLLAPVGGSMAMVATGFAAARPAARQRLRDERVDAMVAELRSVLPSNAEASPAAATEADARRRRAG